VQVRVMDMHLLLADQVRFEMMRRLGWLDRFSGEDYALFDWVRHFESLKTPCRAIPPMLSKAHEGYERYCRLGDREKETFIRRLLPEALTAFARRLRHDSP